MKLNKLLQSAWCVDWPNRSQLDPLTWTCFKVQTASPFIPMDLWMDERIPEMVGCLLWDIICPFLGIVLPLYSALDRLNLQVSDTVPPPWNGFRVNTRPRGLPGVQAGPQNREHEPREEQKELGRVGQAVLSPTVYTLHLLTILIFTEEDCLWSEFCGSSWQHCGRENQRVRPATGPGERGPQTDQTD